MDTLHTMDALLTTVQTVTPRPFLAGKINTCTFRNLLFLITSDEISLLIRRR